MPEALWVCVDSNEASQRPEIVNYLRLSGCEVEVKRLPICDYVVSDRCGVERKDAIDLASSLKDGRLFNQAREIAEAYERPILILEGRLTKVLRRSKMRPSSLYGALASLALDYDFSIIPTADVYSTALLIQRLAYREQVEERAERLADLAYKLVVELSGGFWPSDKSWGYVMIGGAPYLMPPLQRALLKRGLKPLYAFSRREVIEEAQPDGSVRKSIIFRHIGWVRVPTEA